MILITGATGRVGGATSRALSARNITHRILVRSPEKWSSEGSTAELVAGDLTNPEDVAGAVAGVTAALLVTSNAPTQPEIERTFATLAADAGVTHLVKVSSMEAAPDSTAAFPRQHFESEEHIRSLELDHTFLRPNFFMQNLLMYAGSIVNAGLFALPLGRALTAPVDSRDVGAVAAQALAEPGHRNKSYDLTGPELVTFDDVATVMTEVLGRPVRFVDQTPEAFREVLSQFLPPGWQLDGVCELFGEIAGGSLAHETDTVRDILGHPPISVRQFVIDHAAAFSPTPG
ncbi:MAG: SDR family oxidoreductase [Pseudomonadota bacterium]